MPLETRIKRKGKLVKLPDGWDWHALNCFLTVGLAEGDPELWSKCMPEDSEGKFKLDDFGMPYKESDEHGRYEIPLQWASIPVYYLNTKASLWKHGEHIVKRNHRFMSESGELLIKAGDKLEMWRS